MKVVKKRNTVLMVKDVAYLTFPMKTEKRTDVARRGNLASLDYVLFKSPQICCQTATAFSSSFVGIVNKSLKLSFKSNTHTRARAAPPPPPPPRHICHRTKYIYLASHISGQSASLARKRVPLSGCSVQPWSFQHARLGSKRKGKGLSCLS